MNNTEAIKKAIRIVGSQERLAKALGITQGAVSHWLNKNKGKMPPLEYVYRIEELTDGIVTKQDLRPDVFGKEKK